MNRGDKVIFISLVNSRGFQVTLKLKSFTCPIHNGALSGVNMIPKKADFLDPKIIVCPQLKKMPPI